MDVLCAVTGMREEEVHGEALSMVDEEEQEGREMSMEVYDYDQVHRLAQRIHTSRLRQERELHAETGHVVGAEGCTLLGAGAVGLDLGDLGADDTAEGRASRGRLECDHEVALRRLEGEERGRDTHQPIAVGGGLRPPQDRPPPSLRRRWKTRTKERVALPRLRP